VVEPADRERLLGEGVASCGGLDLLAGEAIGNGIIVPLDLDVIIQPGTPDTPLGKNIAFDRQWSQSRTIKLFEQLTTGDANAALTDPTSTSPGFATLLAAFSALAGQDGDAPDSTELVAAMTAVARNVLPTIDDAFNQALDAPEDAAVFTSTEQAVAAHNQRTSGTPIIALYPDEGTFVFDYPAVAVTAQGSTTQARAAVRTLMELFNSEEAVEQLHAQGFRAPDGSVGPRAGIGDGIDPLMPQALPPPPSDVGRQILAQWAALSQEMRMLAVLDVSGSMIETDGGDVTRAEFVRDAAINALGLFPEHSEVGMWVFSTFEDEPNDRHWRELVPLGALDEDVGDGVTQLEALVAGAQEIPGITEANVPEPLRGWTALYETTLAAFNTVKGTFVPTKVNSVVLLTDGADEWPPGHSSDVDREGLLAHLESHDPSQPIPIIAIGIGPDADMDALQAIAAASGGSAHQALDPADIQQVFVQAMIERQCRPNC
jgi:hypothetical protein